MNSNNVSSEEFVVYVLYSEKYQKIYIGYTSSLIERYKSHNHLSNKGYTCKFRPWIVVYVEFHNEKEIAIMREKQLKSSRGRDFIKTQIIPQVLDGLISVS
jgi:putative endonuclease